MPVCFSLTPRHDPGHGPMSLVAIDKVICDALGQPCHPKRWLMGWHDYIGFRLAMGTSIDKFIAEYERYLVIDIAKGKGEWEDTALLLAIAIYIRDNFISDNWWESMH